MKKLIWAGSALEDLRSFPPDARQVAGHELFLVQQGLEPDDWKLMPSVGSGVFEIRIRTATEHRVFYVTKLKDAIVVLHAFQKKSQRTAKREIDLGRERYRAMLRKLQETTRPKGDR